VFEVLISAALLSFCGQRTILLLADGARLSVSQLPIRQSPGLVDLFPGVYIDRVARYGRRTLSATGSPTLYTPLLGVSPARPDHCFPPTAGRWPGSPITKGTSCHRQSEGTAPTGTRPWRTQLLEFLDTALGQSARCPQTPAQETQRTQTRRPTRSSSLSAATRTPRRPEPRGPRHYGNLGPLPGARAGRAGRP